MENITVFVTAQTSTFDFYIMRKKAVTLPKPRDRETLTKEIAYLILDEMILNDNTKDDVRFCYSVDINNPILMEHTINIMPYGAHTFENFLVCGLLKEFEPHELESLRTVENINKYKNFILSNWKIK